MTRIAGVRNLLLLAALTAPAAVRAQTPTAALATPPATARHFTILSTAGKHGESALWTASDGTVLSRDSILLRGQVWEEDEAIRFGADGMPSSIVVRGVTPQGDAAETFAVKTGTASWKSPIDSGSVAYGRPAFYSTQGGTFAATATFLQALLKAPGRSLSLLPGGMAHADRLTTAEVGEGSKRITVTAWAITGLSNSPVAVWATADGDLFGVIFGLAMLPVGYEGAIRTLEKAQDDAFAARSPTILHALLKTPSGPVAFTHVRAFLDGSRFATDQTVIVEGATIARLGPASTTPVPAGAQVIDGAGKTLVPGLWDSHQHVGDDFSGPMLLSLGITSARDPGNNDVLTIARRKRRAAGELLGPTVYPSKLIDGKGPNTAQVATVVTSEAEALAAVRQAAADHFTGVKFYGTYDPAWVAPAAAEAHRLGLHVHGHLPAGMRPSQAIAAGYDEITHIYFVSMEAMPNAVVATSNGINRFEGTGKYAKDIDLNAAPMTGLIATMATRHIASDPTLVVVESLFMPDNGDLSPAYAPYVGTLPPTVERGFRQGGFAIPKGFTREDYRKSFSKEVELVGAMHRAGVRIVAGTDGSGLELVRELELYRDAGFTPEDALASATIEPARMYGVDGATGSIAVGKAADLVLIEGDPQRRIGDLRNTRTVMMAGKLMDADALRAASGFSGRPKTTDYRIGRDLSQCTSRIWPARATASRT